MNNSSAGAFFDPLPFLQITPISDNRVRQVLLFVHENASPPACQTALLFRLPASFSSCRLIWVMPVLGRANRGIGAVSAFRALISCSGEFIGGEIVSQR